MTDKELEVPRWTELAAWATVGCTIPSCIWRVTAGFGVDVGFTGELGRLYHGPTFVTYVWILTLVSQSAALLTLGLVRPWGEWVPAWIPVLGSRRIHPLVAIVPAALGGLAVTTLSAAVALSPRSPLTDPDFPHGTAGVVMGLCYAPLLAWGPLVIAVTAAYARRRYARP
ncbi:hypothetical protein [Nocardia stercoris]|uniref:Uncharacterized protein n=1 Tax=Nocardia stercoris TaxID=2483361 RepID=A0A3M2L4U3_9NOCA|nr:hypothetical protein [Nocardia stercoris]RMI32667.1 hypothetical protein EBN03_11910 [Nocardia stercoris]